MITSKKLQNFYTLVMLLAGGATMFLIISYSLTEDVWPWQQTNGEFSFNRFCLLLIAFTSLLNGWRRQYEAKRQDVAL